MHSNVIHSQNVSIVYCAVCSGADQISINFPRHWPFCVWNSPLTGEFPAQRGSNAENVSIWWRHISVESFYFQRPCCSEPKTVLLNSDDDIYIYIYIYIYISDVELASVYLAPLTCYFTHKFMKTGNILFPFPRSPWTMCTLSVMTVSSLFMEFQCGCFMQTALSWESVMQTYLHTEFWCLCV